VRSTVAALARIDQAFWTPAKVAAAHGLAARVAAAVQIGAEHQPGALLLRLQDDDPTCTPPRSDRTSWPWCPA